MIRMYVGLTMFGMGIGWMSLAGGMFWWSFFSGFSVGMGAVIFCQGLAWLIRDIVQKPWGKP